MEFIQSQTNKLMTINNEIPSLRILPIKKLQIHELHDNHHTSRLVERLRYDGVLRNPLIVTPLRDRKEHYVVLDGANRFSALRKMGSCHILTQVVEPDDPNLKLHSWSHVVWENAIDLLLNCIRKLPNLELQWIDEAQACHDFHNKNTLVRVYLPEGEILLVSVYGVDLMHRIDLLKALVESYVGHAPMERTSLQTLEPVTGHYPNSKGLVVYPRFTIEEVLRLAMTGQRLPAGITRFSISPRALHLNYPLLELKADKPLAEKNADLQRWQQAKKNSMGVRFNSESTVLFDE
jgi:hypothetical protein